MFCGNLFYYFFYFHHQIVEELIKIMTGIKKNEV